MLIFWWCNYLSNNSIIWWINVECVYINTREWNILYYLLHNYNWYQILTFSVKIKWYIILGTLSFFISLSHLYINKFDCSYCPACRTTLVATRFRAAVICPIIQVPHCIRVFFYFVWFVFIHHIFQFHNELCTYCNILDIYLSWNLNFVNYVLFYMKWLNYLFFSMFGSVLESCELTGVCLLLPWLIKWK